jgi:hypothetical protein
MNDELVEVIDVDFKAYGHQQQLNLLASYDNAKQHSCFDTSSIIHNLMCFAIKVMV